MVWMLEAPSLLEELSMGIERIVVDEGIQAVSMRRMAALVRMAPSSLHEMYGPKARIMGRVAFSSSERRLLRVRARGYADHVGAFAFLPATPQDLDGERVWAVWQAAALAHHDINGAVVLARQRECQLLSGLLSETTPAFVATGYEDLEPLRAMLDGLTAARVRRSDPMSHARASDLLVDWLTWASTHEAA